MSLISVKNLSYAYEAQKVLDDISFTISEGEIVGILGLSGSGKTTLMKILSGLLPFREGSYEIEDKPAYVKNRRSKEISQELGVVFQEFNLFMHRTVIDNLALPYHLRSKKPMAECRKEAMAVLESLGLQDQADKYPFRCSGGQQQRIAIGRALILKPTVLLIDEPTSSLDAENTQKVIDILKGLHETGLTLILITHDMAFAKALSQRVIVLEEGKIKAQAKANDYFND
jgi:ABC-type polar amino acid transport system ATPase subunit